MLRIETILFLSLFLVENFAELKMLSEYSDTLNEEIVYYRQIYKDNLKYNILNLSSCIEQNRISSKFRPCKITQKSMLTFYVIGSKL
jgi:hypothetical protein